jgi:uncharacterized protein (DUF1684 family)
VSPPDISAFPEVELADWRRQVATLYERVRGEGDREVAHRIWREGRRALLRDHPQSPLGPDDPMRERGPNYWPYDPSLRFVLPVLATSPRRRSEDAGGDGVVSMRSVGEIELPSLLGEARLALWWIEGYAGGLFLPLRDGTAGDTSYGGGRYLLDTAKGADLGMEGQRLVVDLNFLYHPSCRYSDAWTCPLADYGNRIDARVLAGEQL